MTDTLTNYKVAFRYLKGLADIFHDESIHCTECKDKTHCTKRFFPKTKIHDVIVDIDGYPYIRYKRCTQKVFPPDDPDTKRFIEGCKKAREKRLKERPRTEEMKGIVIRGFNPEGK